MKEVTKRNGIALENLYKNLIRFHNGPTVLFVIELFKISVKRIKGVLIDGKRALQRS